jgi:hypothetical protein
MMRILQIERETQVIRTDGVAVQVTSEARTSLVSVHPRRLLRCVNGPLTAGSADG